MGTLLVAAFFRGARGRKCFDSEKTVVSVFVVGDSGACSLDILRALSVFAEVLGDPQSFSRFSQLSMEWIGNFAK